MSDFEALLDSPEGWVILGGMIFLVLLSNACHEGGHALAAWLSGDRRGALRRRVTLNPLVHFHWFLTLVLPVLALWLAGFILGGARPVVVDAGRIGPRRMALVALAGPAGNFLFAGFCVTGLGLAVQQGWLDQVTLATDTTWRIVMPAAWFSVCLGFLNLLPLPPFDGSRIVGMFLPHPVRRVYYALFPLGLLLGLGVLLWFSGALWHWGIRSFGRGHPEVLQLDLPDYISRAVMELGRFWGRVL